MSRDVALDYRQYLRLDMMPHILCPGCGHGIVLKAILRAVHRLGLPREQVVFVSGIGCSSRLVGYVDFCTLHTTHGRPLTFATGVVLPLLMPAGGLLGAELRRLLLEREAALRDARRSLVRAATAEERSRLSRELHDSVAKTLHGIALSAAGLPTLAEGDPAFHSKP